MSTRRRALAEIGAVLLTAGAFVVFHGFRCPSLCFIAPCVLLWGTHLARRVQRDRSVLRDWGLRLDNLEAASVPCFAVASVAAVAILAFRLGRGWRPVPPSFVVILLLYPFWGIFQQFCVQALFVRNLETLGVRRALIVPVTAVLFGLVHVRNEVLLGLCTAAGAVWTVLFLRWRNLIPIGLSHGWLGTLVYYFVLEKDPLPGLFGPG